MKRIFTLSFLMLFAGVLSPVKSFASWSISQSVSEKNGQIGIVNTMTCTQPQPCMFLCGSGVCEWDEPVCTDCFGTSSEALRDIYSGFATYQPLVSARNLQTVEFAQALKGKSLILLNSQSPYDFFNSSQDAKFTESLKSLCGFENGFVAVELDEDQRPMAATFAVCFEGGSGKAAKEPRIIKLKK